MRDIRAKWAVLVALVGCGGNTSDTTVGTITDTTTDTTGTTTGTSTSGPEPTTAELTTHAASTTSTSTGGEPTTGDTTTGTATTVDTTTTTTTGCADSDGDTLCDDADNCPGVSNLDQADADEDTVGDACDLCPAVADPEQLDGDADLIGDACDLCPATADPEQLDGDADLIGDACDLCPATVDPEQLDGDADLIGDACDLCPDDPDPEQADADADGQGDACDLCAYDGPEAALFPNPAMTPDEVTIADVFFTATDKPVIVVSPGAAIQLQFDWTIKSCPCPGCINQGYIGIPGETTAACFYSGGAGCNGQMGHAVTDFVAPDTPGTYLFEFQRVQNFVCNPNDPSWPWDVAVAAVCVVP
ncbi:thrombospondin type 3 repeat-containing protein [Nannocystis sp. SCPEA4]|uniref:thrombospondin type 3 repeat-containing protein n=1 Tax=Nannocystis sp. SCPEA4 TaxID=2996787 RepID=UPI00226E09DA|nr:thrombospondin type 3 repeat-containing protein [Nannocystis sp. SCPEA4]MCY1060795.1 thrombospondin type 3 repeat-containing protein [Nannocystis sp. SCPEA4]